jgi:uncharacterized protein involved in exopolysaccharide biosynthesis
MKFRDARKFVFISLFLFLSAAVCFAQSGGKTAQSPAKPSEQSVKFTPAYAELLLRKTELESLLDEMSEAYTEDYPKVKETRYQLGLIEKDLAKLSSFGNNDLSRMTLALGKLMVRRAELEAELWSLKTRFSDTHPDVVRAKRRLSSFEKAVGEILP